MVLQGNLSFLDKLIEATNLMYADQNVLFLRIIIGIQISNTIVSLNKLKEMIFERYEKISLSNECAEVISTNLVKILLF